MRHRAERTLFAAATLAFAACAPAARMADVEPAAEAEPIMCEPPATDRIDPLRAGEEFEPLEPIQRDLAMKLLAIFENRAPSLQYAYVENLGDGRGFTVGAVGFTTGTSDALEVLHTYRRLAAREDAGTTEERLRPFAPYLPVLERFETLPLGDPRRSAVDELAGFDRAWSAAAADPLFRAAQDSVAESMYVLPALRFAATVGLRTALARSALIDTIVQHGGGDDPDGLPVMLAATMAEHGRPEGIVEERRWLAEFLGLRRRVLECAHGVETRPAWRESVTRVDVYRQLLDGGNMALEPPLVFELDGEDWLIFP